jgi:hypothetical protein
MSGRTWQTSGSRVFSTPSPLHAATHMGVFDGELRFPSVPCRRVDSRSLHALGGRARHDTLARLIPPTWPAPIVGLRNRLQLAPSITAWRPVHGWLSMEYRGWWPYRGATGAPIVAFSLNLRTIEQSTPRSLDRIAPSWVRKQFAEVEMGHGVRHLTKVLSAPLAKGPPASHHRQGIDPVFPSEHRHRAEATESKTPNEKAALSGRLSRWPIPQGDGAREVEPSGS